VLHLACMFWRSEVVRTGSALDAARKSNRFALKMCSEAYTRSYVADEDPRLRKWSRVSKAGPKDKGKGRADAMDEDAVIHVDSESSESGDEVEDQV
jgi:hypothetical protein